jgi:hypothetical protein
VGAGRSDALDLGQPVGDDVGQLLVLTHPDHRHEVGVARDGVDLRHAVEGRDVLGDFGDPGGVAGHEDNGCDHGVMVVAVATAGTTARGVRTGSSSRSSRSSRWPTWIGHAQVPS